MRIYGRLPSYTTANPHFQRYSPLAQHLNSILWIFQSVDLISIHFSQDLYKSESLPSMKLWDWCEMSTKRPDLLKEIPRSLIDLLEKCLTVNPRLRITADEALKHEFFAPCHEVLKKQRLHRQMLGQDSQHSLLRIKSIHKPAKISQVKP